MNASEQARGLELATKIASVVSLFKLAFPDAKADLKPWHNDPNTREWIDPNSIDIGFHLPGWSPRFQSRSILVQIRFHKDLEEKKERLIGVEMVAFNHQGQAWRMSTIDNWQLVGSYQPVTDVVDKLKQFCRQVFELFNP
jgi:polygalacturonase